MAQTFIGRMISLTSNSDIRYTGILEGIDQQNSTITLKNVFSLGTENRQPPGTPNYVPPNPSPYNHVVFKAQNVKDISVDDPQPAMNSAPNDPAVLSAGPTYQASGYPAPAPAAAPPQAYPQAPQPAVGQQAPRLSAGQTAPAPAPVNGRAPRGPKTNSAGVDQATRAMGNMQIDNGGRNVGGGGGGSGGGRRNQAPGAPIPIPDSDFDFQSSNARFNKVAPPPGPAASSSANGAVDEDDTKTNPSDSDEEDEQKKQAERDKFYNPSKSFFDTLSTSAPVVRGPGGGGGGPGAGGPRRGGRGGGGGGRGRNRREEEREKNVATFGDAGGVGILGPGAYVGGWGNGSQGRRRGGASAQAQQQGGAGRR